MTIFALACARDTVNIEGKGRGPSLQAGSLENKTYKVPGASHTAQPVKQAWMKVHVVVYCQSTLFQSF